MSGTKEVFLCGIAGAVGSLCGKLALSENGTGIGANQSCTVFFSGTAAEESTGGVGSGGGYCTVFTYAVRAFFFSGMLACNAFMLSNFLIALEKKGSLVVVIVSSSTNIILTGFIGQLILNEDVGDNWYAGASLMLMGVALIAFSQDSRKEKIREQIDDVKHAVK